jgi:hypothetical protein
MPSCRIIMLRMKLTVPSLSVYVRTPRRSNLEAGHSTLSVDIRVPGPTSAHINCQFSNA